MVVWPLGEPVVIFCVKSIAMGELEISVEGSCRLGVGGTSSCSIKPISSRSEQMSFSYAAVSRW
jgi:hypothetical protein